jgi:hypothetical protein
MDVWSAQAAARLEAIRRDLDSTGLTNALKTAATEVWHANRDRFEPDELFDDNLTLSFLSSRNLANRVRNEIDKGPEWRTQECSTTRNNGTLVVRLKTVQIQIVKAPHSCGRGPNFLADFTWTKSESRSAAAARNDAAFSAYTQPTLWDETSTTSVNGFARCSDVFVIWAADLSSGLTAGWLGLPSVRTDRLPWLGVTPLWWDDVDPAARREPAISPTDRREETTNLIPVPSLRLKPSREDRQAQ